MMGHDQGLRGLASLGGLFHARGHGRRFDSQRAGRVGAPLMAAGSPTVRRRRLAPELRGIRESKGKSGDVVAAALKWSPSKISRYERARTGLRPREVERLLDYYGITEAQRALLLGLAEDAAQKGLVGRIRGQPVRGLSAVHRPGA
jgi:hypothetical protein